VGVAAVMYKLRGGGLARVLPYLFEKASAARGMPVRGGIVLFGKQKEWGKIVLQVLIVRPLKLKNRRRSERWKNHRSDGVVEGFLKEKREYGRGGRYGRTRKRGQAEIFMQSDNKSLNRQFPDHTEQTKWRPDKTNWQKGGN